MRGHNEARNYMVSQLVRTVKALRFRPGTVGAIGQKPGAGISRAAYRLFLRPRYSLLSVRPGYAGGGFVIARKGG
jgi:hypothetical protein